MQTWKALLITVLVALVIFFVAGPTVQHLTGVLQYFALAIFAAVLIGLFEYLRKPKK